MINEIVLEYTCLNKTRFKELAITFMTGPSDPDIGGQPCPFPVLIYFGGEIEKEPDKAETGV